MEYRIVLGTFYGLVERSWPTGEVDATTFLIEDALQALNLKYVHYDDTFVIVTEENGVRLFEEVRYWWEKRGTWDIADVIGNVFFGDIAVNQN